MPKFWQKIGFLSLVLLPVALFFKLTVFLRRSLYRLGVLQSRTLRVPVIVVGNITVGGTGKTPVVMHLANMLAIEGYHPGIISRGYKGDGNQHEVFDDSLPDIVGDEPLLIKKNTDCPVWVGPSRYSSGKALLEKYPHVDVVISDDGLQHYALSRNYEVVIVDGMTNFGNNLPLPAGPLREPINRIAGTDLVIINGEEKPTLNTSVQKLRMKLEGTIFRSLRNTERTASPEYFHGRTVAAAAGIGNPKRFFNHLKKLGILAREIHLPDHHKISTSEINEIKEDVILVTEKDALKCPQFEGKECWFLPVTPVFNDEPIKFILKKLR